jgi:hypothetical protein
MTTLLRQPLSELRGGGRLPGALQAEQQNHPRPLVRRLEPPFGVAEERHHFVADDPDHLLGRRQTAHDAAVCDRVHRPVTDAIDERLHDLEIDVGFEQRQPDFAEGSLDVLGCQPRLSAKAFEDVLESCAEGLEHDR